MMIGTIAAFAVFQPLVGHDFWSGFGALSASWMGGSANMVAVKEAAGTPDAVFLPMVVVDTIVPYVWMGCLVFASTWQEKIDRWLGADQGVLDDIRKRMGTGREAQGRVSGWTLGIVGAALAVSWGVSAVSQFMPVVTGVISSFTWTVILVSLLGLACSLTPVRRWQAAGSTQVGYWLLFFVLTTIGAKASITHLGSSVVLLGAGFMIVIIHAVVLLAAARLLRAPLMLAATASQANIGGAASAPIVAEIYQPGLSTMGLLMAVLGNIIGTYLGILTGQLCRLL
jgi:uncharacterized membrane protein